MTHAEMVETATRLSIEYAISYDQALRRLAYLEMIEGEWADEVGRLKRQRHELKRQIACRDRRAAGMDTCEGCGKWLQSEDQHLGEDGCVFCDGCWDELMEVE